MNRHRLRVVHPIYFLVDFFLLNFYCLRSVQIATTLTLGSISNPNFLSLLTFSLPHPPPSARALRRYRRPHPVRCRRPRPRAPPRGRAPPSPAPPSGRAPPPPAPLCAASPPLLRATCSARRRRRRPGRRRKVPYSTFNFSIFQHSVTPISTSRLYRFNNLKLNVEHIYEKC